MLDGVFLLDKPHGASSAQSAKNAQRLLAAKKAGHSGTLDPMATGLLVVLLGQATRYTRFLISGDKMYLAQVRFGAQSDTDDADGVLTAVSAPPPNLAAAIAAVLPELTGDILQTPPVYSALKYRGRPMYAYARNKQEAPAKPPRQVRIDNIQIDSVTGDCATLKVCCGSGVYIRALARDIGLRLGCGAYLSALRRTTAGGFDVSDGMTPSMLEALSPKERQAYVLPIETVVAHLPQVTLCDNEVRHLGSGIRINAAEHNNGCKVIRRVFSEGGQFAGLAEVQGGYLYPVNFLHWTRY